VGRARELAVVRQVRETANNGKRQIVAIKGEPGIGKSALLSAVRREIDALGDVLLIHGECCQQHGAVEAYLPLLDGLGRLCRGQHGRRAVRWL
jgi:predicted ATPase